MTIEKLIEANTAAVEELTATMKKALAVQEAAFALINGKTEESPRRGAKEADEDTGRGSRRSRRDEKDAEDDDRGTTRSRRDRDEDSREERTSRRSRDEDEDRGSRSRDRDEDEDRGSRRTRDRDEEKPTKEDKPARASARDKKPKPPKAADVRAAFATFLETDDAKEEDERREFIESILDELGVDKTSEIKEDDFERVLKWVADKTAGKKVRFDD